MNNYWTTSVTELLGLFKGSLIAIIPWLEKAKIKWKEGEAYDDWDDIAETLFKNIVCASLIGEIVMENDIAKYNFHYDDYSTLSFIEAIDIKISEKKFAFVAFKSDNLPLDYIVAAELDYKFKVIGYNYIKFDNLKFMFVKNFNGQRKLYNNIEVEL